MLYRFQDCELDDRLYELRRTGVPLDMEHKVFDVLAYLLQHRDRVVPKDELLDKLWPGMVVGEAALTRCITAARKALGDDGGRQEVIKTQHGRGYRFVAAVTLAPPVVSSQQEVISSQYPVASREEANQKAKGENGLESSVESLESEEQRPVMTGQTLDPRLSDSRLSDPRRQTLDAALPTRSWLDRRFVWLTGVLLVAGALGAIWYLFLPLPSSQPLTPNPQPLLLPDKPSIVVLPFVNMSKDPEQEYFSDGLTEVLTGNLSQISSLFVISRNSAFTYKGKAVKAQDVSKEMGVRYVLEGSVQRADQRVRITTQLIDATTGFHLWSEQYDRPLTNLFTLQDEIVQKIVTTLKLQLTLREQGQLVRKTTNNLEAYDYYLRGVEYFWRLTKEGNTQARQMYEKALALDPQYAEAYAWLGMTYWEEWVSWRVDPQTLERALALAQQALALDDSLPLAHSLLSIVYVRKQQYDSAIAEGERAIVLDPNNADSYAWQAETLNDAGRLAEALRMMEHAMRLNPRYPGWYLEQVAWVYRLTGRYAEAVAMLKELIRRSPNYLHAYLELADSYVQQWASQQSADSQTLEQALEAAQRGLALSDSHHFSHIILGSIYLWQKQYEQALAEMERAVALEPNGASSYAGLAIVLSSVGRSEEALKAAERALRLKPEFADIHLLAVGAVYAAVGRPEEAIAPLQRFLNRYPNMLYAHLNLAAVYSELGREAEARAEVVEVLRINPQFSLEIHRQRAPIKDPVMLERRLTALRKAGLK